MLAAVVELDEVGDCRCEVTGEGETYRDMSTAPWLPVSSASDGRSLSAGDVVRSEVGDLLKLILLLPEWSLRNGELAPPTNVLELMFGWWTDPALDSALDPGRD